MNYFSLGRLFLLLTTLLATLLFSMQDAFAVFTPPTFSSCPNVSGNIQSNFPNGDHAIVGISGLQTGSDQVFNVGNNDFVQCFCAPSGAGIQTNWLAADSLSTDDINNLVSQGWVFITNGADWGLSPIPYLAQNLNFSCSQGSGGGSGPGGGSGSSGGGTGGTTLAQSTNSSTSPGEVLGISTLAGTSSESTLINEAGLFILGVLLICYGLLQKRVQKKRVKSKR